MKVLIYFRFAHVPGSSAYTYPPPRPPLILLDRPTEALAINTPQRTVAYCTMPMIEVEDEDDYEKAITVEGDKLVVVEWGATWCKNCKRIEPAVSSGTLTAHVNIAVGGGAVPPIL